jgi:hypothetical protein
MASIIRPFINKFTANPTQLFLVDGVGAVVTGCLLIFIRLGIEGALGMPLNILSVLSWVAFVYALYSLCCYFFVRSKWSAYLRIIGIANAIYCCVTMGLIFQFHQRLTGLGIAYFIGEVIIIAALVWVELTVCSRLKAESQ